MSRYKVFIANPSIPKIAHDILKEKCDLIVAPGYDKTSILQNISGADAIFWSGSNAFLYKDVLDAAGPQLKVIATMSATYGNIYLKELKERGIKLANTPNIQALDNAVADVAMLLALSASRRVTEGRLHIEQGTWINNFDTQWMLGQDIAGSTIGIIGLGGVGQAIAKRLKVFDVGKIIYTGNREKSEGKELGAQFVNLDNLTQESDFIFLSAPLNNQTDHMCNAAFFAKMKKTAIFINVSRGQMVDQPALINALKDGTIFAAGLDVVFLEPLKIDSELLKLPNVVLTPHIGGSSKKAIDAMAEFTAQNILLGLAGEEMLTPVQL